MNKKTKAFIYNFLGFAFFFSIVYFFAARFTGLTGLWIPLTSAVVASLLTPKFQAITYMGEEKLFMKWLFIKGIKEIK
ncbi:hypothetical protein CHU92_04130 [Flavobacterium cyanobacteriorum]|uniref:Uncharacterized protein n=1 Tax=Flavobacterium cyanobacteriorum TaxID=2022802 RepID=A0A255ZKM4_9FLAO|nr:hypothetical protein [Flavobacterium cyanobacteriorum]OYQ42026.1 hypothetical protein CHU92_04130 [Flavobacterium cyanobacteriorum]